MTLEIIAASGDDAVAAADGGADRLELCSALALGGLTPTLGTLAAVKAAVSLPVMAMVRPRQGGMAYTAQEFAAMQRDAELLLEAGAEGLVFGFLTDAGEVDVPRCRDFLRQLPLSSATQTVFHRAFDVVRDPERALEQLIDLGMTRVLTSGRAATALAGAEAIRRTVQQADGRIEVLPGGGIRPAHVRELVAATGVEQVHLYLTREATDPSASANPNLRFGVNVPAAETAYPLVDAAGVRAVRETLDA